MAKNQWLALSYTVPAEPSKSRVYVWRRLRALGAQPLRSGLAVLPNNEQSRAGFLALAEKIRALSGESTLMEMDFADEAEHSDMKRRFDEAGRELLRKALEDCGGLLGRIKAAKDSRDRAALERELQRKLKKLDAPSGLISAQAADLERAAGDLLEAFKGLPAEFSSLLRK